MCSDEVNNEKSVCIGGHVMPTGKTRVIVFEDTEKRVIKKLCETLGMSYQEATELVAESFEHVDSCKVFEEPKESKAEIIQRRQENRYRSNTHYRK